jgi:hypothetical protein
MEAAVKVLLLALLGAGVVWALLNDGLGVDRSGEVRARLEAAMPIPQRALIAVVTHTRELHGAAENDMLRGAVRPARAARLCQAVPETQAVGWVGTVAGLSSTNDGHGVLTVRIGNRIQLATRAMALGDGNTATLIPVGSPLFQKASALREGQLVRFSRDLFRDPSDCFRETSVTVGGSMTEPRFLFRFRAIEPV